MRTEVAADEAIAALAATQWGVVARRQLLAAGLTEPAIHRRRASGRLLQLHRGVYAVGHRQLRREGHWLAAVLAVPGSVLSHRDAAGLHGLRPANHARIDVTGIEARGTHKGVSIHRTRTLDAHDIATVSGIPVTTVSRTLVDLAGVVPRDHLGKAIKEADHQRKLDVRSIGETLDRTRTRRGPGHAALTQALEEHAALATTLTRSALEVFFQRLVRQYGVPKPHTNIHVAGMQVDAVWPDARLVVELDGWDRHKTRYAFQRDRERDVRLQLAGYRVLRFTHADVVRRPHEVAASIGDALDRAPAAAAAI